jgi:N-succinyldiaminopimelate aminotransferase
MNPNLDRLQPYPFQKLAALLAGIQPDLSRRHVNLSIGEPKHATPDFIRQALASHLDGLSSYPATLGSEDLRQAIAAWIKGRYGLPALDASKQVIPVNGSREALFAIAQTVIDSSRGTPVVVAPNPFYQIYEGAALLANARLAFLNLRPENRFALDLGQVDETTWAATQLVYLCSPANPTGNVLTLNDWKAVFTLADRHGFVVASDECYSEIYFDEPPLGALDAARQLGRTNFEKLVVFSSLSKRSNVPGMRSGFVAGDAEILKKFLLYRTYHGCAMNPAVQAASAAAWRDEAHAAENRRLYREKFTAVVDRLSSVTGVTMPEAAFYLWMRTPVDDQVFARTLFENYNVTVLPGSFLAREAHGINPGHNFVRIALVAPLQECMEAAERISNHIHSIKSKS